MMFKYIKLMGEWGWGSIMYQTFTKTIKMFIVVTLNKEDIKIVFLIDVIFEQPLNKFRAMLLSF